MEEGAQQNLISGNLISGNSGAGIQLEGGQTLSNTIWGNTVGANISGTLALSNTLGIVLAAGTKNNLIGGSGPGQGNLISGNRLAGLNLQGGGTSGNRIQGNRIGTTKDGVGVLGNGVGIGLDVGDGGASPTHNLIGGVASGEGNNISANQLSGLTIQQTDHNQVQGNLISGNGQYGILLEKARSNTIGISNTITANLGAGIALKGANILENTLTRNLIHSNGGLPIDYLDIPEPLPPLNILYQTQTLSGTVCANCRVVVFANPTPSLAGTLYVGQVQADSHGHFLFSRAPLPGHPYLALTITDPAGTTSEFYSKVVRHSVYLPSIQK
jgi:titin